MLRAMPMGRYSQCDTKHPISFPHCMVRHGLAWHGTEQSTAQHSLACLVWHGTKTLAADASEKLSVQAGETSALRLQDGHSGAQQIA